MATHDYVIDNSTGANVRADINSVLQAILTNNSSSSAPGTTAAYMFWADTNSGILKIRNSADNAWIELLQLDGTLTLEDGSASTPGLAFRDDLDTGIFSAGANEFNIGTAGIENVSFSRSRTIFNDDGENTDFIIEGDADANLFYVDAGNDRIGLGISTPQSKFHVKLSTDKHIIYSDGQGEVGNVPCIVPINDSYSVVDLGFRANHLNFAAGTGAQSSAQKMTIDDTGVAIGTGNIDAAGLLHIDCGTDKNIVYSGGIGEIGNTAGFQCVNDALNANTGFGIRASEIRFAIGSSEKFRITSNGVTFNGDTAEANALSDYEEGDFTFHLRSEGGTNASMSGRVGRYVKIGQTVHIIGGGIYSGDPDNRSASNAIEFTNLPFTNVNTSVGSSGFPFPVMMTSLDSTGLSNMNGNQPYVFLGRLDDNATSGRIVGFKSDGNQGPQNASLAVANNTQLYCMFTYQTTA